MSKFLENTAKNTQINARQLCFLSAFVLPTAKLLDAPASLAKTSLGDLIIPAFLQYAVQSVALFCLLLVLSKTGKGIFTLIKERWGETAYKICLIVYAAYFLFYALLPLLDLEKYVYSAFYDSAPYVFTFTPFFILCGYISSKTIKSFARICDLSMPLFLISFAFLCLTALPSADFGALLPVFETPFENTLLGVEKTACYFFDVALFLPLFEKYDYKKGDGKKILLSYLLGGAFVLLFLAIFFGVYTSIAPREHYALSKIAQYFPALAVIGRVDLIFVYILTGILFFTLSLPVLLSTDCLYNALPIKKRSSYAAIISFLLFLFVFFFNKRYDAVQETITSLILIFFAFSFIIPVLSLLFLVKKRKNKGAGKRFIQKNCTKKGVNL